MGSYGLQARQALYSALKVPLLVGVSTAVCLPNFYTVNMVLGLGADFVKVIRAILVAQGTVAIVLAQFFPGYRAPGLSIVYSALAVVCVVAALLVRR